MIKTALTAAAVSMRASTRSDVWCRSTIEPSVPTVAKLRSRADSAIEVTGADWGAKACACIMASRSSTGARSHADRVPSCAAAMNEFPPSIHSRAVIGDELTREMSVSSGASTRCQWCTVPASVAARSAPFFPTRTCVTRLTGTFSTTVRGSALGVRPQIGDLVVPHRARHETPAVLLEIRDLPDGTARRIERDDTEWTHIGRNVLENGSLVHGDVAHLHQGHTAIVEAGGEIVTDGGLGGRDNRCASQIRNRDILGARARREMEERQRAGGLDRVDVLAILVDTDGTHRRGGDRRQRGGHPHLAARDDGRRLEQRQRLGGHEHENPEHGDDHRDAAKGNDDDGGAVDTTQTADAS